MGFDYDHVKFDQIGSDMKVDSPTVRPLPSQVNGEYFKAKISFENFIRYRKRCFQKIIFLPNNIELRQISYIQLLHILLTLQYLSLYIPKNKNEKF